MLSLVKRIKVKIIIVKREEIKNNCIVIDRWFREYGTGRIIDVKKTVFTIIFGNKTIKYDYAHAQFLDKCE
jgi:hypothetical protein